MRESADAAETLTGHLLRFLEEPGIEVVQEDTRPVLGHYAPGQRRIALE